MLPRPSLPRRRAMRPLAPHEVVLIALLEVVLGPIWTWLWTGEMIPAATLQGGCVVLAALAINAWLGRPAPMASERAAPA